MTIPEKKTQTNKGRRKENLPKLFRRGSKGFYYFRKHIGGKDKWLCTDTADIECAKTVVRSFIKTNDSADSIANSDPKARAKVQTLAQKLGKVIAEGVTGSNVDSIEIKNVFKRWVELDHTFADTIKRTQSFYESVVKRFVNWCQTENILYLDQIDRGFSLRYAKELWETGITAKTYNDHLKLLSRVFNVIDAATPLPFQNPFDHRIVSRKKKSESQTEGRQPLEPGALAKVIKEAANNGHDFRDLFIIGAQTGMRLKDAVLLQWESIQGDFIAYIPYKTEKSETEARVPISPALRQVLDERRKQTGDNEPYVIPVLAAHYLRNDSYIIKKSKEIFNRALDGKENTQSGTGKHRQRKASIFSFHSFRTTFMSLLAAEDVSTRDAMRMMGWSSPDMIQVYEKMLQRTKNDYDRRSRKLVDNIDELKIAVPEVTVTPRDCTLKITQPLLQRLVPLFSYEDIGRIFGISGVAVKKHAKKYHLERTSSSRKPVHTQQEIAAVRQELQQELLNR